MSHLIIFLEYVDKHNKYRRQHQKTPDLRKDSGLEDSSKAWAKYLAESGQHLTHDKTISAGENILWSRNPNFKCMDAIKGW